MTRSRCNVALVALVALAGCAHERAPADAGPPPDVPPRARADAFLGGTPAVWGAADLHAHPASHLALGGNPDGSGGILFGRPDIADVPRGGTRNRVVLSRTDSCDGEAHVRSTTDFVTRLTHSLAFPLISDEGHRAHVAMHAGPDAPFAAWPHAQDLYHQQMYTEMIRRAFDGGLRLMFASITENQSLSRIMGITLAPGALAIDPEDDVRSVEEQAAFIHALVASNSDFMAIATSPEAARSIIAEGRLAIVLGLEIDYLPIETVQRLHDRWGVRTIVPIHLADSPVGGTAAYTPMFNMHSALYGRGLDPTAPLRWFELAEDPCVVRRMERPLFPQLLAGVVVLPTPMGWTDYVEDLGYESCDACAFAPRSLGAEAFGHRNRLGLRDAGYIRALMRMGMLVDVVHMSIAAASDTVDLAERWGYPLLDTHTGVSSAGGRIGQDRDLPLGLARRIYRGGGLVGLGSRWVPATTRVLYHAEGSPIASFGADGTIVQLPPVAPPVALPCPADFAPSRLSVDGLACPAGATCDLGTVDLVGCDGATTSVPVDAAGEVLVPSAVGPLRAVDYRRASAEPWCAEACAAPGPPSASGAVGALTLSAADGTSCSAPLAIGAPAHAFVALDGACASTPVACFGPTALVDSGRAGRDAYVAPRGARLLRVTARMGGGLEVRVRGASSTYEGTDVTVRLTFSGLEPVSVSLNHRGLWLGGTEYQEHVALDSAYVGATLGAVELVVDTGTEVPSAGFQLAELRVEDIEDPVMAWSWAYDRVRDEIAAEAVDGPDTARAALDPDTVVMAFGTDLNGFAPQIPTTSLDVPPGFEMCSADTGACYPLRIRERGVANYAMLADFLTALELAEATASAPLERSTFDALFSTAEATIRVWERAEAASGSVP